MAHTAKKVLFFRFNNIGGAGRGQRVMVYKDFEIVKQKNGKYAIIAGGYVIAYGRSVEACEDYIDELIYNE